MVWSLSNCPRKWKWPCRARAHKRESNLICENYRWSSFSKEPEVRIATFQSRLKHHLFFINQIAGILCVRPEGISECFPQQLAAEHSFCSNIFHLRAPRNRVCVHLDKVLDCEIAVQCWFLCDYIKDTFCQKCKQSLHTQQSAMILLSSLVIQLAKRPLCRFHLIARMSPTLMRSKIPGLVLK